MKRGFYLLIILLTLQLVSSATIQGTIYDLSLDKVKNVIVEINTAPNQKMVASNGEYSFSSIPNGKYTITAYTYDNILKTNESILIERDGNYNIDLFLIPELEGDEEESDIFSYIILLGVLSVLGFIIVYLLILKRKKVVKKENIMDSDLEKVIEIIKKEGNRTTQKDIREKLGLSEAKVSLMITELEDKGKIKRIKRGRANIIILQ